MMALRSLEMALGLPFELSRTLALLVLFIEPTATVKGSLYLRAVFETESSLDQNELDSMIEDRCSGTMPPVT